MPHAHTQTQTHNHTGTCRDLASCPQFSGRSSSIALSHWRERNWVLNKDSPTLTATVYTSKQPWKLWAVGVRTAGSPVLIRKRYPQGERNSALLSQYLAKVTPLWHLEKASFLWGDFFQARTHGLERKTRSVFQPPLVPGPSALLQKQPAQAWAVAWGWVCWRERGLQLHLDYSR